MVDSSGNNLVFLLCTPRSGSSLATVMLQNHSKLFATQEMWFLMSLYDLQSPQRRAYGGTGILNQFYNGVLPQHSYEQACRAFALQVYNGLMQSSAGAEMVIDKSPRYYYLLEFLDALFPHSRRIWLIRNPFAVLSSHKKVNGQRGTSFNLREDMRNGTFDMKVADLTIGLFRYFRYFAQANPYTHRLSYEKLVASPREQMIEVCRFLGVAYEEGLELYGNFRNTAKSDLYFSMGVGDPFVSNHSEANQDSIAIWKDVLDKQEIEMYGRVLGAQLFHDLGYSEELAEAEKLTGVRFELEPDTELMDLYTKQLADATGCRWEADYEMRTDSGTSGNVVLPERYHDDKWLHPEELQLQMTVRMLEKRLENSAKERRQLKLQLDTMKRKANRLKMLIPFGNRLSQLASTYFNNGRLNK
ncbi:sulfotransferase family protein [Paenibacillus lignilyticus]|uniref:Sulfotransferase n=1 Tax=Paenibacillus lignilyticus TaxID=1172615 RepID=A0ABS5C762_9BACL|nr:sulfotransferase [Paenibacillus lignilyticus]MBP3961804.1 sulfotransferase [Paenibacillus lignilyticus]MBP3963525.1 sulfotransferase [Paenibacillus lignilyticus]